MLPLHKMDCGSRLCVPILGNVPALALGKMPAPTLGNMPGKRAGKYAWRKPWEIGLPDPLGKVP